MLDIIKCKAEHIVIKAGGMYIGTTERLVLFNSRETGSTLAMPIEDILTGGIQAVEQHINESNFRFAGKREDVLMFKI